MAKYIEQEAFLVTIERMKRFQLDADDIAEILQNFPSADVAPVLRGKWKKRRFSETVFGYECEVCHTTWDEPTNYCPNCGAKME